MKKQLLFASLIGLSGLTFAQSQSQASMPKAKISSKTAAISVPVRKNAAVVDQAFGTSTNQSTPANKQATTTISYTQTTIGTTTYDLQSNATGPQRIVRNSDGTLTTAWTYSNDKATSSPAYADRGTATNYFDGTAWGAAPTARIESDRRGFPTIGTLGTGEELVVSHGSNIKLALNKRTKGTGAWTTSAITGSDSILWPRLAVGGPNNGSIHIIGTYSGPIVYQGVKNAILYFRSKDGGTTWDINKFMIPQLGPTFNPLLDGESYAITAHGNNLAIAVSGKGNDVVLLKSTDNGDNWSRTVLDTFPIPLFDDATMTTDINNDNVADTIPCNDGSVDVILDAGNKAHVFWGTTRVSCSTPGTASGQGLSWFPGYTNGLVHWNENNNKLDTVGYIPDLNGDGVLNLPTPATAGDWTFGMYTFGLVSLPSAGADASGNLYIAYTSVVDSSNNGAAKPKAFRHTYVRRSDDNGLTWHNPLDIVDEDGTATFNEGVFGSMAEDVDTKCVHILMQVDATPGSGLSGGTSPTDPDNLGKTNNLVYVCVNPEDLKIVGLPKNEKQNNLFGIYPNPASNQVNLSFQAEKSSTARITVYNVMGQEVAGLSSDLRKGANNITLNLNAYAKGIYFINATVDGKQFVQKLVVE